MSQPNELPGDVVRFAEAQVAAGRFKSVGDVLRAGIEALVERDDAERNWLSYAREAWNEGVAASARGDTTELTSAEFSTWLDGCLDEASR